MLGSMVHSIDTSSNGQLQKGDVPVRRKCFSNLKTKQRPLQDELSSNDSPFMSIRDCCVHWGTGAIAPPGAARVTPTAPSYVGPRLLHVYCCPCSSELLTAIAAGKSAQPHAPCALNLSG